MVRKGSSVSQTSFAYTRSHVIGMCCCHSLAVFTRQKAIFLNRVGTMDQDFGAVANAGPLEALLASSSFLKLLRAGDYLMFWRTHRRRLTA